ncbi:MAG: hypothetical protein IT463_00445, partial [Planctomycetes bacterium]|nr:hypothetical protein [Planctomycetota bacterium]
SGSLKKSAFLAEEQAKSLRRKLAAEDAGLTKDELAAAAQTLDNEMLELEKKTNDYVSQSSVPDQVIKEWLKSGKLNTP